MLIRKALPYALAEFCLVAYQWTALLFLPLFFKARGLSESEVGLYISLFSFSTLLLIFPLGVLSDRIPPRPMIVAGALLVMAANLVMHQAHQPVVWACATAASGAGFSLSNIALFSLFFKQIDEGRRGREVSFFNIGGVMGAGVGAWMCGAVMDHFHDLSMMFILSIFFGLAWAVIALVLPPVKGIAFPILEYKQDLRHARTWVLIAIIFITASHAGFEQAGYTLLQTESLGLSAATVGRLFLIIAVWMSLVSLWTGRLHDRRERPLLMMGLALIVSGVFMAASGSARGEYDFLLFRLLHTTGDSIFNLLTLVVAAVIFPRHRSGGAFAFVLTVNTASYFAFANLAGLVGDHYGIPASFHLSGLIMAAGGASLLIFRPRLRRLFRLASEPGSKIS